ncbi:MAG: ubiquitin-like domain-containing protein [Lachnospiraceae bacterium]|nr:ubiquitin-like domain-containing protein [Lachnospiraceae bacterium]
MMRRWRRTKEDMRYNIRLLVCLWMMVMMTGCGKRDMQVVITDGHTQTRVKISAGETVEKALERAEIPIDDKDNVTPELSEKITESGTEITILRHVMVTVRDGEKVNELELMGGTVQDALDQTEIALNEHDYLNHSPEGSLTDGMDISVVRRLAVTISVDGETRECLTTATDVESLLAEQHIAVDKKDRVSPARTAKLSEGSRIAVERVSVKEIVEREPIAFETQIEYSNSMYSDESVEKTPGVEGEKEVTYQVTYVDGKEESRKPISEKVIKEPTDCVMTQGTKKRRQIVSRQKVPDCDGSGHGYYIITWSDGTVEYEDY